MQYTYGIKDEQIASFFDVYGIWFYGCRSWLVLVAKEIGIQWTMLFNVNTFSVFQSNATGSMQFAHNKNHACSAALVLAFTMSVLLKQKDWFFGFKV